MTQHIQNTIHHTPSTYFVEIKRNLLRDPILVSMLSSFASRLVIITDSTVAPLYGLQLKTFLQSHALKVDLLTFPAGERHKTREIKQHLEDLMLERKCNKDTCILALGGGVVTDMAGYIAATYCRGLPLVMIPTTLLGMVDASLGGKVGVNVPSGKNMLGSIYHPRLILIDPTVLQSLPIKELKNGIVEMIKHGLIADQSYVEYLENHTHDLLNLHPSILEEAIFTSCQIKLGIVREDEKETQGKRHLLNCGHTIGHALETLTRYQLSHGEAVAIGLVTESYLSMQLGFLKESSFEKIRSLLSQYGCLTELKAPISINAMLNAMNLDKKSQGDKPRFVLLHEIGHPCSDPYCRSVDATLLQEALDWLVCSLCLKI